MEKPIRILHVLGALNRGGAETMIMNIYRNIDRSKIQFDFMIHTNEKCDYDDEIIELGGKIYSVPRYVGRNHFKYKKSWNAFFKSHFEYKIVHGHMRSTASIYLKIAKKHGLITIAHSHSTASRGNKIEQLVKNIMQFPIKYTADYLFACSNEAGKWLFGKNAIKKDNYRVIKNAINVEKYVFNESKRNEMRRALGIGDKFVVGHVGSFTYPKNHKFLIDVFYQVQMQNENAILLLVGDGELRQQIEKQINKLGIKDKVILTRVVPNVNEYLQAMDVFVFPSLFEGLGISVIEAQTAGLQCIVSDMIPEETFITDLIMCISIKQSKEIWADEILKQFIYRNRNNTNRIKKMIKLRGYDVKNKAIELQRMYEQYVNEYGSVGQMKNIKWITDYDIEMSNERRRCALSNKNIDDYIFSILVENGWNVSIVSPAITTHEKGYYKRSKKNIKKGIQLNSFSTFGAKTKIGKALSKIYSIIQLFFFLVIKVKKNEPIIVGHSLIYSMPVYFAKKIKKFKLILKFNEEYNKVKKGNILYQWAEPKIIKIADKYIFANDLMGDLYSIKPQNYIVIYGQYQNNVTVKKKNIDNKIHLVYAGIISKSEKSAFRAIELAKYLDEKYVIHILGKIDSSSEECFYSFIKEVNSNSAGCQVIYEGVKTGDEYIKQMTQYDIGLNLRSVNEEYIDFAFPSKVLSYLNVGLRVVSSKIKCVEQSEIGNLLEYYDEDAPDCIATVIKSIDLQAPYLCFNKLKELDKKLRISIDSLIIE